MNILDSLVLGIVEGVSEFLPISSTGHLILASVLLGIPDSAFLKSFEIAIQLGAIGAVVFLYWRLFFNIEMLKRLFVGFVPTAVIGLALYSFIKSHLLGNVTVVLAALLIGGVALIVFELLHKENEETPEDILTITYWRAFCIGLFQSLAVIPGISRSAATIVGGLLLGVRRSTIVEFSFLLAVPTMAAATGLDLLKSYSTFSLGDTVSLAVGFVAAFIVALLSIKFLLRFIKTHTFVPFGIYRIVVSVVFWLLVIHGL